MFDAMRGAFELLGFLFFLRVVYQLGGSVRERMRRPGSVVGDESLAGVVASSNPKRAHRLAVVVAELGREPRFAFIDSEVDTPFEIGSVTKAMTGMVIGSCIEAGEFTTDTSLQDISPTGLSPALGSATVGEICTHTTGLPRLPRTLSMFARSFAFGLVGVNPYRGISAGDVLAAANRSRLSEKKAFHYSNLGAATAGNIVAAAHGTSYAELLRQRLTDPLGMQDTSAAVDRHGVTRGWGGGWRARPWPLDGYAPMGGVVSTPRDMARWCTAMLDGSAPGGIALDPIVEGAGLFWMNGRRGDERYVWHNGQTSGYSSYVAVCRQSGWSIVVLADSTPAEEQQRIARHVLDHQS